MAKTAHMKPDKYYIHPEIEGNISYWSRKWGVAQEKVHRAIMETGSLCTDVLKDRVHADSWIHHPFRHSVRLLRTTVNFIF
jgi:hypothetical protein